MKKYVLGFAAVFVFALYMWHMVRDPKASDGLLLTSSKLEGFPAVEIERQQGKESAVLGLESEEDETELGKHDREKIVQVARLIAAHPEIEDEHHSNIYGLFGALRRNGGVYLGKVGRLIPASEGDEVRQWGVAEIVVEEVLLGGRTETFQVPYFYDDWEIFVKNGGAGGYGVNSPWMSYIRNRDSLFIFVTTDGYDNRIFAEEEASRFSISRKVHSIYLVSGDSGPVIRNFQKTIELFNGPAEDRARALVTELFSPGVEQSFFSLGIERLFFDVAKNDPDTMLAIIEGQMEKSDPSERAGAIRYLRDALSSFDHALKTKNYTYSP